MVNIFIANLTEAISERELSDCFSEYGAVHAVQVVRDRQTGHSKRYAFLEMSDAYEAAAAIAALNGRVLDGQTLVVDVATNQQRRISAPKPEIIYRDLYIAGLPYATTAEELRELFSRVADVRDVRIILNGQGEPKGIAFLTVENLEQAESAIREFNGYVLDGRTIGVDLAGPNRSESRRAA